VIRPDDHAVEVSVGEGELHAAAPRHLALVGATATGKTALAVAAARALPGVELVSVDAMAVYRRMDLGTAKPTAAERQGVQWHLLDLVGPEEEFSVSRFQAAARAAVGEIEARRHVALFVGGTGLYHRAVVDGLDLPGRYPRTAASLSAELAAAGGGLGALYDRLRRLDPVAASRIEPGNERRILRALEVTLGSGRPFSSYGPGLATYPPSPVQLVGLELDRAVLAARIEARLDAQLTAGFLGEVEALLASPAGWSRTARQALGYRELAAHLEGRCSLAEARAETLRRTRTFARRQEAWFRRDPRVAWLPADGPATPGVVLDRLRDLVAVVGAQR
jgi:tRNA dimethylallyltransferase